MCSASQMKHSDYCISYTFCYSEDTCRIKPALYTYLDCGYTASTVRHLYCLLVIRALNKRSYICLDSSLALMPLKFPAKVQVGELS